MRLPTSEECKGLKKPALVEVLLPELGEGVGVYVPVMNVAERRAYEELVRNFAAGDSRYEALAKFFARDEAGNSAFTDEQLKAIAEKDARPLDRIITAGIEINAVSDAQRKAIKKNS